MTCAMASICVHRATRTPPDSTPGHIRSRDDLPEDRRPDTELPHTALRARSHTFLQFIWHPNRPSRALQGTSACAMASICVHRAPRTSPDSTPRHIRSRDDLPEDRRPDTDLPRTALRARSHTFLQFIWHGNRHSTGLHGTSARAMASICVHREPRTPPDNAPGHIHSRDGIYLCPSSAANPSRQHSRAYPLAR